MAFTTRSSLSPWAYRQSSIFQLYLHQTRPSSRCHACLRKLPGAGLAFRSTMASNKSTTPSGNSDPPPFEYVPLEGVERLEKYRAGGYHPILIGDILRTRYRVVHKLGYGTYSTTWLCRDDQSNRYVAVKVGTAESNSREADVLDFLNYECSPPAPDHPGRAMIASVQDRFVLYGPNGIHPCYVTAPARCSVSGAKDGSYKRLFQAGTARSLIVQLVLAVEYIHARGVVHGG
jgi:serine/threonine-protein kinase SRPK3